MLLKANTETSAVTFGPETTFVADVVQQVEVKAFATDRAVVCQSVYEGSALSYVIRFVIVFFARSFLN